MMAVNSAAGASDWLRDLLVELHLEPLLSKFKDELLITKPIHLECVSEEDLERLGLSQPTSRQLILDTVRRKFGRSSSSNVQYGSGPADVSGAAAESRSTVRIVAPGLKCLLTSSELSVFESLGASALGVLHRAEWNRLTGKSPVAARTLYDGCLATTSAGALQEDVIAELNAMYELKHHNIIQFIGIVSPTTSHTLLTEYAEIGSLKSCLLTSPGVFGEFVINVTMLLNYAVQVVHALIYMERKGYVHGNVAACNIMLTANDQVKIGDYGLARILQPRQDFMKMRGPWFAPENFESFSFSHSSDSWMFGVTLWEMFSNGADPWKGFTITQIRKLLCEGKRLPRPMHCPDQIYLTMTRCWSSQPKDRLQFEKIHSALNEVALPVMKSAGDHVDGQFEVKNGDDLIVIKGGSDSVSWTGQNRRTGAIGLFPQSILSPPIALNGAAAVSKQNESEGNVALCGIKSEALMEFEDSTTTSGLSLNLDSNASIKPVTMAGWTTFNESMTDLSRTNVPMCVNAVEVPKDSNLSVTDELMVDSKTGSDHVASKLPVKDSPVTLVPKKGMNMFDLEPVEIDVSDCDRLLPAASLTSLSEPCSPAHSSTAKNPNLLRNAVDNMSFDDHDGDAGGYCHSLPAGKLAERVVLTSSASCENLNACLPQRPAGHHLSTAAHFPENLSKASSDSPVYVVGLRGNAPPVPPRDYPKRAEPSRSKPVSPPQHPEIHPIVQYGQQRSTTHYWLLPEKMKVSDPIPCPTQHVSANHSPYINMTDNQWNRNSTKHPRSASGDAVLLKPRVFESGITQTEDEEAHASMSEACEKIELVRALLGVESVSSDEVLTALTGQQWSVESAVKYLKVEHLFRLGLATRTVCRTVLDAHRWELESAASALLDQCGNR